VNHLSFKEYLVSKADLRHAINETPFKISKYRVAKYCKLEVEGIVEALSLKPNNELIIEWLYTDINAPTVECVVLMTKESNIRIMVKRDSTKLTKWLNANCITVD
jgi:hypothetical protein